MVDVGGEKSRTAIDLAHQKHYTRAKVSQLLNDISFNVRKKLWGTSCGSIGQNKFCGILKDIT